jgi:hypothetical protein
MFCALTMPADIAVIAAQSRKVLKESASSLLPIGQEIAGVTRFSPLIACIENDPHCKTVPKPRMLPDLTEHFSAGTEV